MPGRSHEGRNFYMLGKTPQVEPKGSFRTSEWSTTAGLRRQSRENSTQKSLLNSTSQPRSNLHTSANSRGWGQGAGAQAWVSDPREKTRVGSHEGYSERATSTLDQTRLRSEKRLGVPEWPRSHHQDTTLY